MTLIAPSILSADFGCLADEVRAIDRAGADWVHVDVMDGHFVDNLTIGPVVVEGIAGVTDKTMDVHLMIEDPEKYATRFLDALDAHGGSDRYISVHREVLTDDSAVERVFRSIEEAGAKPGIVINPGTKVESVLQFVERAALILVMSVEPGWGGQPFDEGALAKLSALREQREKCGSNCLFEVDGGINLKTSDDEPLSTAQRATEAGADVLVAGSAVFGSDDYAATIAALRNNES